MLKMLLQTFLGLLLFAGGIYAGYFYLTGISTGVSPLFLVGALLLFGAGVFFLFRAGKSDATVITKMHVDPNENLAKQDALETVIEKNNAMSAEWEKTTKTRDQLKMLEVSGAAQKPD